MARSSGTALKKESGPPDDDAGDGSQHQYDAAQFDSPLFSERSSKRWQLRGQLREEESYEEEFVRSAGKRKRREQSI